MYWSKETYTSYYMYKMLLCRCFHFVFIVLYGLTFCEMVCSIMNKFSQSLLSYIFLISFHNYGIKYIFNPYLFVFEPISFTSNSKLLPHIKNMYVKFNFPKSPISSHILIGNFIIIKKVIRLFRSIRFILSPENK